MRLALTVAFSVVLTSSAWAQTGQTGVGVPDTDGKHSGAPLGQFTAGPFVVTPTFRIGTLAVDTNVQYSRTRRADFIASAGPGLDIALPFLDHWKLDLQGASEYFYFHRTKELRRWTGGGTAALLWKGTGTKVALSTRVNRDFSRPNFEVDTRIASNQKIFAGVLERNLGRLTLQATGTYAGSRVDQGQEFRGVDLALALTTDRYRGGGELRYTLTPVTSAFAEGAYEQTRFPKATIRNFFQASAGAGLIFGGVLKGRASAGLRRTQLRLGSLQKTRPYFGGDLAQQLGRRFRLTERYTHESNASAFATDGELPTFEHRSFALTLVIEITHRIDMNLSGIRDTTRSDGLVQVIRDDGTVQKAKRDDLSYIGRADLGIRLGRARTSVFVSYTTRKSEFFQDFGIDGLQAGMRVEYTPQR